VITYIVVIVVIIAVLYGSYRLLAGGSPVGAEDYRTMLARLAQTALDSAQTLTTAIRDAHLAGEQSSRADPLVEAASGARKILTGCQQRLTALESDTVGDERESLEAARAVLAAAIDDCAWACRIVEAGTYRDNPGMQRAVDALLGHAHECLASVSALTGVTGQ
jgi:hypothetical protein